MDFGGVSFFTRGESIACRIGEYSNKNPEDACYLDLAGIIFHVESLNEVFELARAINEAAEKAAVARKEVRDEQPNEAA